MWMTLIKIARPFVQSAITKRAAQAAADYLNRRREQRLQLAQTTEDTPDVVPPVEAEATPLASEDPIIVYAPKRVGFSGLDVFWFTLSGFFFGGTIGIVLAYVTRKQE